MLAEESELDMEYYMEYLMARTLLNGENVRTFGAKRHLEQVNGVET